MKKQSLGNPTLIAAALLALSTPAPAAPAPPENGTYVSDALFSAVSSTPIGFSERFIPQADYLGGYMFSGDSLVAPGCAFHLEMQSDGNLVTYYGQNTSHPVWATGTSTSANVVYANFQSDGNLVLYYFWHRHCNGFPSFACYSGFDLPLWASNTSGHGNQDYLMLQNDGNLVIYNGNTMGTSPIWSAGHHESTKTVPDASCTLRSNYFLGFQNVTSVSLEVVADYTSVPTFAECGYWCNDQPDMSCQEFNYDPSTQECVMGKASGGFALSSGQMTGERGGGVPMSFEP